MILFVIAIPPWLMLLVLVAKSLGRINVKGLGKISASLLTFVGTLFLFGWLADHETASHAVGLATLASPFVASPFLIYQDQKHLRDEIAGQQVLPPNSGDKRSAINDPDIIASVWLAVAILAAGALFVKPARAEVPRNADGLTISTQVCRGVVHITRDEDDYTGLLKVGECYVAIKSAQKQVNAVCHIGDTCLFRARIVGTRCALSAP